MTPEFPPPNTSMRGFLGGLPSKAAMVWDKGLPIPGKDRYWDRLDEFGSEIHREDYGDRDSIYGWEIDHIKPACLGGCDELWNLRPLHHRTNSGLGGLLPALNKA